MVKSVMFGNAPTPPKGNGLSEEDKAYLRSQGLDPDDYVVDEAPSSPAGDFDPNDWEEVDYRTIEKEVSPKIRLEIAGLASPEDRLTALKRHYADAMPVGEDNFVMTGEDGDLMVYNQEGRLPSWGDFAEAVPEAGGIIGSIGGAAAGGIIGTAASPGLGNLAGGVTGAGLGYGAGKGATRDALQWAFGTQDTRETSEKAKDFAIDSAIGAAGEGLGRGAMWAGKKALGAVGSGLSNGKASVLMGGSVDDTAKAAERLATYEAAGITPTPGQVGGDRLATAELARSKNSNVVQTGVENTRDVLNNRWAETVDTIGAGDRQTIDSTGGMIRDAVSDFGSMVKDRSNKMYDNVAGMTEGVPVTGTNVSKFHDQLSSEYQKAGASAKLRLGPTYEAILTRTKAMMDDVKTGTGFDNLREARGEVRSLLKDAKTPAEKHILKRFHESLTNDLSETAASVGQDALQAFKKTDAQYARQMSKTGLLSQSGINNIVKETRSDAAVYALLTSATKNNSKLADQIMRQVRTAGGEDAVREISSSILSKMGQQGDQFVPGKLLRDWDAMSPEGRSALFKFKGGSEIKTQLDRVVEAQREMANYLRNGNHSNTAKALTSGVRNANQVFQVGTAIATSGQSLPYQAGLYASKMMFDRARNKMFQNPQTLRWLAGLPKQKNPSKYLQTLSTIGERTVDQALKLEIREYLKDVSGAF